MKPRKRYALNTCSVEMARDYARLGSSVAVAQEWGVSYATVLRCVKRWRTVLGMKGGRCMDEWAERYRAGESLVAIGRAVGVAHETVRRCLMTKGVTMRPSSKPAMRAEVQRSICEMYDAGEMVKRIAEAHGVHTRTVMRALRRDLAEMEARA